MYPQSNNNSYVPPAAQSQLSVQGHSLSQGVLTVNEGQWSNVSQVIRTQFQAQTLNNFQMLTRGSWSCPTGIGWSLQRSSAFNSGAAFMDFGVFEDFSGNQTMLFQVGSQVYSYNIGTSTETAYNAPLTGLSTSLANLPCMRSFLDNTGIAAPVTIYCNGAIQPVQITGTGASNVSNLGFVAAGSPTPFNPKGGQFGVEYPVAQFTPGTFIADYSSSSATTPTYCCLGPDGNVWFTGAATGYIGKISPLGIVTVYNVMFASTQTGITAGPDGRLWVCYNGTSHITAVTTAGVASNYNTNGATTNELGICTDGTSIFVYDVTNSRIGKYATSGSFTSSTAVTSTATSLCYGPDGRFWSTTSTDKIQATTIGSSTTQYTGTSGDVYANIIAGPGGTGGLYFANTNTNAIGFISVAGTITQFTVPTNAQTPAFLTIGSDGNIWFTVNTGTNNNIGRLTVSNNSITVFTGPPASSSLQGICTGVDGNLWFCESGLNKIGTMLVATVGLRGICSGPDNRLWFCAYATNAIGALNLNGLITLYPLPNATSGPFDICSDGTNLWFTEQLGNRIGKITTAGIITEYTLSTAGSAPTGICYNAGDTNVWFTEYNNNKVAKITSGGSITEYSVTTAAAGPYGICSNGTTLFFCESLTSKINSCTTSGVQTEYATTTPSALPLWITEGSDNRLWFTENTANKIGAMTTGGTMSEFIIPTSGSQPEHICSASDGNLYFTEAAGNNIGRITTSGIITEFAININNAEPFGIVDGPDQSIWFTLNGVPEVGNFLYGGSGTWPGVFQLNKKTYSMPQFCCYFNNRMAYFGFAAGSNAALDVLISSQGLAGTFINSVPILATDAYAATIPGLGLPTGCASFRLTNTNNQEVLILGFQRGISVVMGNGTESDATTFRADVLTYEFGLMSNRSFAQVQNDMYFMSTNGWRSFSNLTINANLLNASLTYNIQDVIASITTTPVSGSNVLQNAQAFVVHHRATLELQSWFPVTTTDIVSGQYQNQHAIIMNYNTHTPVPQQLSPVFSTKSGVAIACGIEFQGVMYGGGYDGHLQVHYSGNTYNGTAIQGQITLCLISAPNVQQALELRQGLVIVQGANNQKFGVQTYFYTQQQGGSLVRTASQEGVQILQSTGAGNIDQLYFEATGQGRYVEFDLTTTDTTQCLDFAGLAYTATIGGLRP